MTRTVIVNDPDWQKCIDLFIAASFDISGSAATVEGYSSILARFFEENPDPDKVTKSAVLAYLQKPSTCRRNPGQPVSASTKNGRCACISSLYKYASSFEILQPDGSTRMLWTRALPTIGIRFLKCNMPVRSMSEQEVKAFFSSINPRTAPVYARDFAVFSAYFWSCARRSALASLKVGELKQATLRDPDGTIREGWTVETVQKGNGRKTVVFEMPEPAMAAIFAMWDVCGRTGNLKPDEPVFMATKRSGPRKDDRQPLNPDYVNWRFHVFVHKSGLRNPERFSLHSLRWSGARSRWENGVPLQSIQATLGHSSSATTLRYLARDTPSSDTGARALFEKFGHL